MKSLIEFKEEMAEGSGIGTFLVLIVVGVKVGQKSGGDREMDQRDFAWSLDVSRWHSRGGEISLDGSGQMA